MYQISCFSPKIDSTHPEAWVQCLYVKRRANAFYFSGTNSVWFFSAESLDRNSTVGMINTCGWSIPLVLFHHVVPAAIVGWHAPINYPRSKMSFCVPFLLYGFLRPIKLLFPEQIWTSWSAFFASIHNSRFGGLITFCLGSVILALVVIEIQGNTNVVCGGH
jgi:hypothetical protein